MRILALTADASLQVAVASMMPGVELHAIADPAHAAGAAGDAVVALVDLGTTARGVEAVRGIREAGCGLPCVVIGDEGDTESEEAVWLVLRPFTLIDLSAAIECAAQVEGVSAPAAEEEVEESTPAAEEEAAAVEEAEEEVEESTPAAEDVAAAVEETIEDVEVRIAQEARDELAAIAVVDVPASESPLPSEPEMSAPQSEPEPLPKAVPKPVPTSSRVRAKAAPAPAPPAEQEPAASPEDYAAALLSEIDAAAPARAPVLPPKSPRIVRDTAHPARPVREIVPERSASRRRLRRRIEPERAPAPVSKGSILTRLNAAVWAGRDLELLLGEMPVLAEPRAIAHAFLSEVVELFGPQTAAIYTRRSDGTYAVLAPHGLSKVEADIRVPPDQPLFLDVAVGRTGVYVAPVDLAQGLVAGIGGARTETLMAAPMEAGGTCVGVVVVGGADLNEADLGRLCDLAAEAAPGLAFAQYVDRMRARV